MLCETFPKIEFIAFGEVLEKTLKTMCDLE